ncbi:MAG: hypothetical protein ACYCZF_09350 [Anaerolineae bacterium]
MSHSQQEEGRARTTTRAVVGALALSGLCLLLGSLLCSQALIWRYLLVALGAIIAGTTLLWLDIQENGYWWILPCAAATLGIALSLGLKMIIPSTSSIFNLGFVLASVGLGLCIAVTNPRSPQILLVVDGLLLFIALLLLLSGIGYAFNWISLAFVATSYGFAIAAIYFPKIMLYAVASVLAAMSLLCAPNPESGLRLFLPMLLIISGLTLLWYSQPDRTLI